MINEVFDDDVDDEFIVDPEVTNQPVPVSTEKPKGDFHRVMAGRTIWFNTPKPGQFNAWKRYREALKARYDALKVRIAKGATTELVRELSELSEKFDLATVAFVESLLVDQADADFIAMEMISGRVTTADIHDVLFNDDEPDDDVEVKVAPKPVRKKPAAKAAANAKRTRK